MTRLFLIACLCVGLAAAEVVGQARAPRADRITRQDATVGNLTVSAPNQQGGYGCAGCLLWLGVDSEITPDDPTDPVRVTIDGLDAFVWVEWKSGVYIETPPELQSGRRDSARFVTVELRQGENRFVGTVGIVSGAPVLGQSPDGRIAGMWRAGDYGPVFFFWDAPVALGPFRTHISVTVTNLGIDTIRRGTVDVWVGPYRFEARVSDFGIPGVSNVGWTIEPGAIEAGDHHIKIWSGRWTRNMPPIQFVSAP